MTPALYLGALFAPFFVILIVCLAQIRPFRALSIQPRLFNFPDINGANGVLATALDTAFRTLAYLAHIKALVQIPKKVKYKPYPSLPDLKPDTTPEVRSRHSIATSYSGKLPKPHSGET